MHQVVEHAENLRMIVSIGWRAMELHQVENFRVQVEQVVFDPGGEVGAAVAFDRLLGQTTAYFRSHDDLFFAGLLQLSNQAVAAPIAVDIRSVEKVDAGVDRLVERAESIPHRLPGPMQPPMAHAPKLISETFQPVRPSVR